MRFSIIIPVLNEEAVLEEQLARLVRQCRGHDCELIIVDGGSSDATVSIAEKYGRVIGSARGRATQLNAGAAVACGETLIFLHADTRLPDDAFAAIERALASPRVVGGAFRICFNLRPLALPTCRFQRQPAFSPAHALYGRPGIFYTRQQFPEHRWLSRPAVDGRPGDYQTPAPDWQSGATAAICDDFCAPPREARPGTQRGLHVVPAHALPLWRLSRAVAAHIPRYSLSVARQYAITCLVFVFKLCPQTLQLARAYASRSKPGNNHREIVRWRIALR